MTDFYEKLMEKSGFDEALIRHALEFSKKIDLYKFTRLFFCTEDFSVQKTGVLCSDEAFYPYEFYGELGFFDLPHERSALYIYISLLEYAFDDFCSRIKQEHIFFDTVKRIADGAREHFLSTGHEGLYDYHFLANHVRGSVIRLGEFEYQYGEYYGEKCIMLHLPDKADLTREKRLYSYSLARQYFGDRPIIGDSWLFYGEHKKMLSGDSRIVDFMEDFDIILTHETTDYNELFHIFGRLSDYSYDKLPKETSLQKAYAERVKNGLPVGSGVGKLKY